MLALNRSPAYQPKVSAHFDALQSLTYPKRAGNGLGAFILDDRLKALASSHSAQSAEGGCSTLQDGNNLWVFYASALRQRAHIVVFQVVAVLVWSPQRLEVVVNEQDEMELEWLKCICNVDGSI